MMHHLDNSSFSPVCFPFFFGQVMLTELPQCVRDLVEWVAGGRATLVCPATRVKGGAQMGGGAKKRGKKADAQPEAGDGWRAFFYHLGQVYNDYELLRHGAQDVVLQLLLVVSADPMGMDDIEVRHTHSGTRIWVCMHRPCWGYCLGRASFILFTRALQSLREVWLHGQRDRGPGFWQNERWSSG
jgi:hypothetical protein